MADVIETTAEVIEAPAALTEADRWLAEQREKVAARRDSFHAFDVDTPEKYRDAKAQRKALRSLIAEVDGDKRRMTAQLRDTLSRFNSEVGGILADLIEEDVQYKGEIERWERQVVAERWARVDARYRDEYPDMAAQVPLGRLRERYGADWKGDNYGSKEAKVWQGVESAVADVAAGLETIGAQTHVNGTPLTDEDRTDLVAEYLRTLDMAGALRTTQERVAQREALRRAEEERRAWEAEQAAAQAQMELDARAQEPSGPTPDAAEPGPGDPSEPVAANEVTCESLDATAPAAAPETPPQGRETVYVFEVEVPESIKPQFVIEMKRLGTHGRLLRKE